jgi:two-component system, OmpR family, phosphate regulon sensor histidine kinase PhoR
MNRIFSLLRSGRLTAALVIAVAFGVATGFSWQVYNAACSQATSAWFLQRTHGRVVARDVESSLHRAGLTAAALATPEARSRATTLAVAALAPLPLPTGGAMRAAEAVQVTLRPTTTVVATGRDYPMATRVLGGALAGIAVDVRLRRTFAAALDPYPFSWDRAQLVIALVTVTAVGVAFLVLHSRRERDAVRLRGEFVAHVSHELRTPLAQLRVSAETLRYGWARTPEDRDRLVATLDVESRRLSHLVENVLSFSSAERAMLRLARLPVDLAEVAREAVASLAARAQASDVQIVVAAPAPCVVLGDRDALRQVVCNLVDNAVKYGPAGQRVTVRVYGRPAVPGSREPVVVLSVEDQGPGIAPAERERVFEPFVRAGTAGAGYGIGLAVVRHIVRLHRAEVAIGDAPGGGASVTLTMAAAPPSLSEPTLGAPRALASA